MDEWMNLSKAAEFLGVHTSTLRNWSNKSQIPVHRTQGGHRRYLRSEIDAWLLEQSDGTPRELRRATDQALHTTRLQISEGRLRQESWFNKLDEEARQLYRQSGRDMLSGMINYVRDEEAALQEAENLGFEYAMRGRKYGMSSVEATHAFLFFRNLLMGALLDFDTLPSRPGSTWMEMYQKVTEFTDYILITILETYEVYLRNGT